jgi:hypothetical protein
VQQQINLIVGPVYFFPTNTRYVTNSDTSHAQHKHATSQNHAYCYLQLTLFAKQQRVDLLLDSQRRNNVTRHNVQVTKKRWKLLRCIDAMCFSANEEFPFQGQDVSSTSLNRVNFMEFLNVLKNHFLKIV